MAANAEELAKRLAALSERFTSLSLTLAQAGRELQAGTVPPESVVDEITKIRTDFVEVRHRILEAARSLSIAVPAISEVDSLAVLGPIVEAVAQALVAQEKKAAMAEARTRVMAVLDRILTVTHSDGPNFAGLVQCLIKAKEIRQAAQDPRAFDSENAPAFLESIPSFAALLSIIEGRDALDDDKFALLDETVTQAFGRTLAVAAARGKLIVGAAAAPAPERAVAAPTREPAARPAAAPAAPAAPTPTAAATRTPPPAAPAPTGVLTRTPPPAAPAPPARNIIFSERDAVPARDTAPAREAAPAREPAPLREPATGRESVPARDPDPVREP